MTRFMLSFDLQPFTKTIDIILTFVTVFFHEKLNLRIVSRVAEGFKIKSLNRISKLAADIAKGAVSFPEIKN